MREIEIFHFFASYRKSPPLNHLKIMVVAQACRVEAMRKLLEKLTSTHSFTFSTSLYPFALMERFFRQKSKGGNREDEVCTLDDNLSAFLFTLTHLDFITIFFGVVRQRFINEYD